MDDIERKAVVAALLRKQTTFEPPAQPGFLPLPEVPAMHQGKLFNIDGRQWSDGRSQSLDFYLQPSLNLKHGSTGLNGFGLLYRKTY